MSIKAITRPLPGERVIAVAPEDAPAAAATWLRRPNLFPGRALTAPTLEARARWSAGRVTQRGQAFTPGVVRGLGVDYVIGDAPEGTARRSVRLHVSAGQGLSAMGEDVVITAPVVADLWALPVVAPPTVLAGGEFGGGDILQPRAVGPSLGEMVERFPDVLPRAAVLVLQPATVERADVDPDDPCDRCGGGEAGDNVSFEDWRYADAVRLLWYVWPVDWRPLPPTTVRFRNRLAYTVFDAERGLVPGALLPWEEFGVPVAVFGLDADLLPSFVDRGAVVRHGGRPRVSHLLIPSAGASDPTLAAESRLPTLWQAQIEQLAEHMASFGDPAPSAEVLAGSFERLPPCGLLPRDAVDVTTRLSGFFPAAMDLDAVPVPVE
ncbi:MAG TPA: hypothetical protein VJ997_02985, partial [Longimicrobiales bacterium]|nr:hypothetical protein [Longimicrobiales bacterium]